MIIAYYRPSNKDQVLSLLSRREVRTVAICGSTFFGERSGNFEVADLQQLGFNKVVAQDDGVLSVGGLITLSDLCDNPEVPGTIKMALLQEYTLNQRNMTTLAGALYTGNGQSLLAGVLLALDARVKILENDGRYSLEEWLQNREKVSLSVIESLEIQNNKEVHFETVRRTPLSPVVLAVALGGSQIVVMGEDLDRVILLPEFGMTEEKIVEKIKNACSHKIKPETLVYLAKTTKTLLSRLSETH